MSKQFIYNKLNGKKKQNKKQKKPHQHDRNNTARNTTTKQKIRCQVKCLKKNTRTRKKTQGKKARTKKSCLLAGSPKSAALSAQKKLQKGQTNTAKMGRINNNNKKKSTTFVRNKINTGKKTQGKKGNHENNKPDQFSVTT